MKHHVEPRPKIEPSEAVVTRLCYVIRDQLYRDEQKASFYGQLKDIKRCVTYPAAWLNRKGVFVTPERYTELVMNILQEVKRNGATGAIEYWPKYLLKVVQSHFQHSGDRYYLEGKAARDTVGRVVAALRPCQAPDQFTRDLAAAHAILMSPGGKRKPKEATPAASEGQKMFGF